MSKKTMEQALIDALLARGETEIHTRATRYRTFTRTKNADGRGLPPSISGEPRLWFVSAGGGLRMGSNHSYSCSAHPKLKAELLAEGSYARKAKP